MQIYTHIIISLKVNPQKQINNIIIIKNDNELFIKY